MVFGTKDVLNVLCFMKPLEVQGNLYSSWNHNWFNLQSYESKIIHGTMQNIVSGTVDSSRNNIWLILPLITL